MGRMLVQLSIFIVLVSGCGCSETGLSGDTDVDGDADISDGHTWGDATSDLPIDNLGPPGWRGSTVPLCPDGDTIRLMGVDVWSEPSAVFLLLDHETWSPPHGAQRSLWRNEGSGWTTLVDILVEEIEPPLVLVESIAGVPGGDIFAWGWYSFFSIDSTSGDMEREDLGLWDLFVVREDLAYGILSEDPRLIRYNGTSWGPYPGDPLPYNVMHVWANETDIFCTGENGIVLSTDGDGWTVHDTGTLRELSTVWGFSTDDVWAGGGRGILIHWDGEVWNSMEWPDAGDGTDDCRDPGETINGIWGSDGVLFFHTINQVVMWDGVEFRIIAYWPGERTTHPEGWSYCQDALRIQSIWGNSPDELFIVVAEGEGTTPACERYLLWWDGHEFHWF
jgi:hypothetical protein